ncbi:nucleotide-binding domain-containing protein [Wallemia mellicola]|uniref:Nucleotide-binding domain-containing protein n=1 Tax=Wallemia mellicola TaxID=1708541 RepID=A0A4T0R9Y6_9BASI|nr:hypothetical protein E3Q23_00225 [Wallemia mellicola]TIB94707.1 nucleotide-binding domain-containing protein [Wallemia mellicola]TIC03774.1 nucleotide-binding domain-containing protein [Wallemia mellicola]TIC34526.1 nucleotide-binding domain-containing protein [Wallemia mellicola]TIC55326.1 nucleotide-binding domain-containing protein [Wallemia mellicola]
MPIGRTNTQHIVILGSGVIGVTTAITLAKQGYQVTVCARDLPTDSESTGFASPWAGASMYTPRPTSSLTNYPTDWFTFASKFDYRMQRWEEYTFKKLWSLIPSGHVMELPIKVYKSEQAIKDLWHQHLTPNFRRIPGPSNNPDISGVAFTSVSLSAPDYLKHLHQVAKQLGVKFVRKSVNSIHEPFDYTQDLPVADLVVNATGLGARKLQGCNDPQVMPIRGQTVVVDAPNVKECVMAVDSSYGSESAYIIPRPNGQAILGGCFQVGNWDTTIDNDMGKRILERCFELNKNLSPTGKFEDIKVLRHNVGLRPAREGGTRLEIEMLESDKEYEQGTMHPVVHAYGIGPAGFQCSWGMARDVLNLVDEHFKSSRTTTVDLFTSTEAVKSNTTPRSCPTVTSTTRSRSSSQRWMPKSPIISPQTVLI